MSIPRHATFQARRQRPAAPASTQPDTIPQLSAAVTALIRTLLQALPVALLLAMLSAPAQAAEGHGNAVDPASDSLSSERGGATAESGAQPQPAAGARDVARYSIHDASVHIYGDYDGDAFYRHLEVTFDADVDHDLLVEVRAELFLSRDGGEWLRYHVTEPFAIHFDDSDDFYVVETELLEGYPPGYYDVAIDLYAPGRGLVASLDSWDDADLRGLPLEDVDRDHYDDYGFGDGLSFGLYAGGGALGVWPALALLAALCWRRRRAR